MNLLEALLESSIHVRGEILIVDAPSMKVAAVLRTNKPLIRESIGPFKGFKYIQIAMQGLPLLPPFDAMNSIDISRPASVGSFAKVTDLMANNAKACCLTDHTTHKCLLLNDCFEPGRLIWSPSQMIGFNFLELWRDSMDDFDRLMQELKQAGKAENFKYRMRRIDGSMAYYVQDYLLVDFLGSPARLAISHEWGIIERCY